MEGLILLAKNIWTPTGHEWEARNYKDHAIVIKEDKIVDVLPSKELSKKYSLKDFELINAGNKVITPGFVDPHTHLIFAGSRQNELDYKLKGYTYIDILKMGGGILSTVKKTRETPFSGLMNVTLEKLDQALLHGITTMEIKSGYGLETETEIKQLRVAKEANEIHEIDIVSTFLGAHAIPEEFKNNRKEYIDLIINEMIPMVEKENLATYIDVFVDEGAFTTEEAEQIFNAGMNHGLKPRVHADEIKNIGASKLAARLKAASADHLLKSTEEDLLALKNAGVVATLLPGTVFSLMKTTYPNARKMIDMGLEVALATDYNPNCWTLSINFILNLATYYMKMRPDEALTAVTWMAARSLGLEDRGVIAVGKKADLIIHDAPDHVFIPYSLGMNTINTVIKNGEIVVNNGQLT